MYVALPTDFIKKSVPYHYPVLVRSKISLFFLLPQVSFQNATSPACYYTLAHNILHKYHDKYELHMYGNMIFVVYFFPFFFGRVCRAMITNHRNLISVDDSLRAVIQKFPSSYESIFQMSKFSTKWLDIGSILLGEGRPIEVPKKVNTSVALLI